MQQETAIWDYKLKKTDLGDPKILKWYLERKIAMADWQHLDRRMLLKHLSGLNISKYRKQAIRLYYE